MEVGKRSIHFSERYEPEHRRSNGENIPPKAINRGGVPNKLSTFVTEYSYSNNAPRTSERRVSNQPLQTHQIYASDDEGFRRVTTRTTFNTKNEPMDENFTKTYQKTLDRKTQYPKSRHLNSRFQQTSYKTEGSGDENVYSEERKRMPRRINNHQNFIRADNKCTYKIEGSGNESEGGKKMPRRIINHRNCKRADNKCTYKIKGSGNESEGGKKMPRRIINHRNCKRADNKCTYKIEGSGNESEGRKRMPRMINNRRNCIRADNKCTYKTEGSGNESEGRRRMPRRINNHRNCIRADNKCTYKTEGSGNESEGRRRIPRKIINHRNCIRADNKCTYKTEGSGDESEGRRRIPSKIINHRNCIRADNKCTYKTEGSGDECEGSKRKPCVIKKHQNCIRADNKQCTSPSRNWPSQTSKGVRPSHSESAFGILRRDRSQSPSMVKYMPFKYIKKKPCIKGKSSLERPTIIDIHPKNNVENYDNSDSLERQFLENDLPCKCLKCKKKYEEVMSLNPETQKLTGLKKTNFDTSCVPQCNRTPYCLEEEHKDVPNYGCDMSGDDCNTPDCNVGKNFKQDIHTCDIFSEGVIFKSCYIHFDPTIAEFFYSILAELNYR